VPLRRFIECLACAIVAAGCAGAPPDTVADSGPQARGFLAGLLSPATSPPPEGPTRPQLPMPLSRATLAGGDVVLEGPEGYCVDPLTVDNRVGGSFAMLASCRILSSGRTGAPAEPLLITVAVGPRGQAGDIPDAAGLAALVDAPLIGGNSAPGFTTANLASGGAQVLDGGDDRHWRAAFVQNGRLVGLALYAPADSAMAGRAGEGLLAALRSRIAALSTPESDAGAAEHGNSAGGLFARLFN
jgi:hypothetical protein